MHIHWPGGDSLVQLERASTLSLCGEDRSFGVCSLSCCRSSSIHDTDGIFPVSDSGAFRGCYSIGVGIAIAYFLRVRDREERWIACVFS